ncbi:Rieske (2Fe-2S) protein [Stygiolobus caldivivus]|uniref:(2Fe-2S)-binding protein n=1 Tax=Stygiolobus caldivivus TaxID=2824673 RepID=A0A8D5U5X7_9CREN|nr:Rieske (2Fe-2S) protein [Stygiolobus caldivivus]BCU69459.1 (2Fe-2S)-binding protein [Stygiolobus caldivivus]
MPRLTKSDFKPGERRKIKVDDKEILVVYLGADRFYAFENKCPHLGCDLSKVAVVIREELVCQCHFTHFSLKDGKAIKGATKKPLKVYSVKVEGEEVVIDESQ